MPKFDQKNISSSLREFGLFFRLYNLCEEEKFQILVEAAPWSIISLYIESRVGKPLNLSSLMEYFKESATPVFPLQRLFDNFSYNKPVQELFNSCNIINSCNPEDIYKLALYTALPKDAKFYFNNKLHLPLELLKAKIAEFWEDKAKPDHHLLHQENERFAIPQRPVPNPRRQSSDQITCYFHSKFGARAFKCEGPPCVFFNQSLSPFQQPTPYEQSTPLPHTSSYQQKGNAVPRR